ncbi:MAG: hypothetical protein IT260_07280 [Saprospiraceae bacterium]|nr:hypothetical protein [Saprospiraceae bacterium]
MKTQSTNPYDFQEGSPSTEPGFAVFRNETTGVWHFHGNDMAGQASIFSQAYPSQDKAKLGLASALEAFRKNRMRVEETPEGCQLILKAGNHQEIARSRHYPDHASVEKQVQFFQQVSASAHPEARPVSSPAAPAQAPAADNSTTLAPFRYAFRIHFYPNDNGGSLSGRIENIKTGEQQTFKGLDISSINRFLQAQVREFAGQAEIPAAADVQGTMKVASTLRQSRNLAGKAAIELLLEANEVPGESSVEACTVALRHMETQQTNTLYPQNAQQVQAGQIQLMLETADLPAGMYFMHASVWLQPKNNNLPQGQLKRLQSTGWFQVM